ncbi:hypothetical protein BH10ACI2_BH10ACI2_17690 [soil metagenome]
MSWQSRTKNDLIIEVWEKLDCESIGAAELKAIEMVVEDRFGAAAVDSPMIIARMLADEGADLRHSEIMELYIERASDRPYDAAFRNVLKFDDFRTTLISIKNIENIRRKYKGDGDKNGSRLLREAVLGAKTNALSDLSKNRTGEKQKQMNAEIAHWLTIWMQTPEIFETWVELRQKSPDFIEQFGPTDEPRDS